MATFYQIDFRQLPSDDRILTSSRYVRAKAAEQGNRVVLKHEYPQYAVVAFRDGDTVNVPHNALKPIAG